MTKIKNSFIFLLTSYATLNLRKLGGVLRQEMALKNLK